MKIRTWIEIGGIALVCVIITMLYCDSKRIAAANHQIAVDRQNQAAALESQARTLNNGWTARLAFIVQDPDSLTKYSPKYAGLIHAFDSLKREKAKPIVVIQQGVDVKPPPVVLQPKPDSSAADSGLKKFDSTQVCGTSRFHWLIQERHDGGLLFQPDIHIDLASMLIERKDGLREFRSSSLGCPWITFSGMEGAIVEKTPAAPVVPRPALDSRPAWMVYGYGAGKLAEFIISLVVHK